MATVTVSLPEPMKDWIDAQAKGGQYGGASDYIRDLIRRDQNERSNREELIQALKEGETSAITKITRDDLHAEARKRAGLE